MSNHALTLLAPESWKSASSQNVSQTISNGLIGSQNVNHAFTLLAPNSWKSARNQNACRRPFEMVL